MQLVHDKPHDVFMAIGRGARGLPSIFARTLHLQSFSKPSHISSELAEISRVPRPSTVPAAWLLCKLSAPAIFIKFLAADIYQSVCWAPRDTLSRAMTSARILPNTTLIPNTANELPCPLCISTLLPVGQIYPPWSRDPPRCRCFPFGKRLLPLRSQVRHSAHRKTSPDCLLRCPYLFNPTAGNLVFECLPGQAVCTANTLALLICL